jgi:hypothetical protein
VCAYKACVDEDDGSLLAALPAEGAEDADVDGARARVAASYNSLADEIDAERIRLRHACEHSPALPAPPALPAAVTEAAENLRYSLARFRSGIATLPHLAACADALLAALSPAPEPPVEAGP